MKKLIILTLCFFVACPVILEAQNYRSRPAPSSSYVIRGQAPSIAHEEITFYTRDEGGQLVPLVLGAQGFSMQPAPKPAPIPSPVPEAQAPLTSNMGGAWHMLDHEERQFIAELNNLRASLGLPPVIVVAQIVHDCRNWSAYLQRTGRFYHGSNQENLAMGHESGTATFQQWRRSPGHNAKLCNRNDMFVGIGRVGNVWTYRAVPSMDTYQSGKTPQ